jgi:hypothetical protein
MKEKDRQLRDITAGGNNFLLDGLERISSESDALS